MTARSFVQACRVGFALQVSLCVLISVGAYTGHLPHWIDAVSQSDKIAHAVLGGLLAFFLDGALTYRPALARLGAWPRLAPVVILAVAGTEELAQGLSPRRSSSIYDYAADVAGVCLFSWASRRIYLSLVRA